MNKRFFLLLFTLTLTMIIAVACSNTGEENDEQNNEEQPQTEEASNDTDGEEIQNDEGNGNNEENVSELDNEQNNEENNPNDDNQSNQDQEVSANQGLPEPLEMNEHVQHPEGVNFTLETITFEEDHISVDFNAENHTGYSQYLASKGRAQGDNLGGITLEDDTGYVYRYVADSDSDRIKFEDGEKVTGTVSFAGRIQDDAESLTLIFNPDNKLEFSFEDIEIK
ncbi:hypothetical protein [Lentibacillus sp. CBA3610]|uniref:hypothetical protein n=1 Tax=Lentibacillus sp. CBA3610 TaxID=2518176 RepID=UPI001595100C|nr:hypothetical protein [Lentibacillus sp. CBA3610]QKY69791.1 hypothetical protein Len3610_09455 [Lentibacillus sp. CBA3610]